MSKFTLWTIDNVLVDDCYRLPFIDIEAPIGYRRTMFDAMCFDDQPITTPEFEAARNKDLTPIFIVDRPIILREDTAEWIEDNLGVSRPLLFMRKNRDHRPISEVIIDCIHNARDHIGIGPGEVERLFTDDNRLRDPVMKEFGIETSIICRSAMSLASRTWCYTHKATA